MFFGKYSIQNHIKTKRKINQLNTEKTNTHQQKTKLIHKTQQLKEQNNLNLYITKKINTINKNFLILY